MRQFTPGKQQAAKYPRAPAPVINVTEDIIATACRKDSSKCMIADSIKASMQGVTHVSVDLQTIRWTDGERGLRYVYLTPRPAQIALIDFDEGTNPAPFEFRLRGGAVYRSRIDQKRPPHKVRDRVGKKAKLVKRGNSTVVPDIVGGRTPPVASAHLRTFGLRLLGRR